MKIGFVSAAGGGADTHVRTSAEWLAGRGHEVHIIYQGSIPEFWQNSQSKVRLYSAEVGSAHYYASRLGLRRSRLPARIKQLETARAVSRLVKSIRHRHGLDVVELLEGSAYPGLYRGLPYIVKLHGSDWTFRHYCQDGEIHQFQIRNERKLLLGASQIHSPSRSLADFIAGACNIPRGAITILPYPLETKKFCPADSPIDPGPPFRLMSVGRLERRKGTHLTVQALREIWKTEPETYLSLFGTDGDFGRKEIEALILPGEHRGRITFHGFVSHEAIVDQYRRAHLIVAPTRYDNLPYMILEAIACGRPVVATDIGGVSDLVVPGYNGWLVPRDDAQSLAESILAALKDPSKRETYGSAGRSMAVDRFSIDMIMEKQLSLYHAACR